MKTFGDRLKHLRSQKNITQLNLSLKLNISQEAISSYERNVAFPNVHILILLANYFDVSCDYLLGLDPNENRIRIKEPDAFENKLLNNFRHLNVPERELLVKFSSLILNQQNKFNK